MVFCLWNGNPLGRCMWVIEAHTVGETWRQTPASVSPVQGTRLLRWSWEDKTGQAVVEGSALTAWEPGWQGKPTGSPYSYWKVSCSTTGHGFCCKSLKVRCISFCVE